MVMPNKRKKKLFSKLSYKRQRLINLHRHNNKFKIVRSLAKLCERTIKKFELLPVPKKFTAPETFSVVGGKPLRKRSERPPPEPKQKRRCPKRLSALCQIVIQKHNLLPECEETLRPYLDVSQITKNLSAKRGKGRPRKVITEPKPKSRRGRPRKDAARAISEGYTSSETSYQEYLEHPQIIRKIKVEDELNISDEVDPLEQNDDFTIMIKEENADDEESTYEDPVSGQMPQASSSGIIMNPLASAAIPGPSGQGMPPVHYVTVLMDEYQAFANNIAEQLRTLPPNRALLLQLDIQSMLDNEKQLILHEQ